MKIQNIKEKNSSQKEDENTENSLANEEAEVFNEMLKKEAKSSEKINAIIETSVAIFIPIGGIIGLALIFYSIVDQNNYWILGCIILFFVALFSFVKIKEIERIQGIQKFALQNGITFYKDPSHFVLMYKDQIELFRSGVLPVNMLEKKTENYILYVFDHTYMVGSVNRERIYSQTVCLFRKPLRNLPQFSLRPESVFHKVASVFGYQDIDFSSNSKFSKKYLLRGKDESSIRELFDVEKLNHFEKAPGYYVEAVKSDLIVYRHNKEVKSKDYSHFIQDATEINNMFN